MNRDRPLPHGPASEPPTPLRAHLGAEPVQTLILALIAAVLLIAALDHASGIAVPTVMAGLAAIALAPLARRIEGIGAPASLAAAVIVAGIVFSSAFAIYALLPSAEAWNDRAPQVIREIEQRIRQINVGISDVIGITPEAEPVETAAKASAPPAQSTKDSEPTEPDNGGDTLVKLVDDGQRMAADWALSAPGIVAGAVYWAVLTFFMLRDREMLGRRVMALGGGCPPAACWCGPCRTCRTMWQAIC